MINLRPRLWIILLVFLVVVAPLAHAQQIACGDKSLPTEQRWNPGTVSPALSHFYSLQTNLSKSVKARQDAKAESIALEYLKAATQFPCNWNYGNAIHDANVVLGMGALTQGRRDDAIRHLREAGKSPGSPQLDSFGPPVILANALAINGAYAEVAAYFRDVKRFWKMDEGKLGKWITELEAGRVPDFGFQLRRPI